MKWNDQCRLCFDMEVVLLASLLRRSSSIIIWNGRRYGTVLAWFFFVSLWRSVPPVPQNADKHRRLCVIDHFLGDWFLRHTLACWPLWHHLRDWPYSEHVLLHVCVYGGRGDGALPPHEAKKLTDDAIAARAWTLPYLVKICTACNEMALNLSLSMLLCGAAGLIDSLLASRPTVIFATKHLCFCVFERRIGSTHTGYRLAWVCAANGPSLYSTINIKINWYCFRSNSITICNVQYASAHAHASRERRMAVPTGGGKKSQAQESPYASHARRSFAGLCVNASLRRLCHTFKVRQKRFSVCPEWRNDEWIGSPIMGLYKWGKSESQCRKYCLRHIHKY